MNIILVLSDTFRRDHFGVYDRPPWDWNIRTPNLNRLAEDSLVFDRFYQGSFPTGPTIQDLLTSHYYFQSTGWSILPDGVPTLQGILGDAGYTTMCITDCHPYFRPGANYHKDFTAFEWVRGQQGDNYRTAPRTVTPPCDPTKTREYEKLVVPHLRNTFGRRHETEWFAPRVFQSAIDWLEENASDADNFLLYVHAFDVHEPWDPPAYYTDIYDPGYNGESVILPRYDRSSYLTDDELNHCRALYAGEVTMVDRWLGLLLDRVDGLGLADDTIVVFLADHGVYLGDHGYIGKHTVLEPKLGWPLYDVIGHCPLVIRLPGGPRGRCHALCQHIDIMPTLLELTGLETPSGGNELHGRSLVPVIDAKVDSVRDVAINSCTLQTDPDSRVYSTVTDGRHTLLYAGDRAPAELYDLESDPGQTTDLIELSSSVAASLHARYIEELEAIGTVEGKLSLRRIPPANH